MNKAARNGIKRLLIGQLVLTGFMTLVFAGAQGVQSAYSAVLGGVVCILPNLYFALKLFRYDGAQAAGNIIKAFYKGEAAKLLITIALFALIFKFIPIEALAFFVTFIVVQFLFWIAPWLFVNKGN